MAYSNSSLATKKLLSPNYSARKSTDRIDTITIHHMAGCASAEACLKTFANKSRQASANYVIGNDGEIGLCVEEKNRAWTSGGTLKVNGETGRLNDFHAVTIEVSNDSAGVKNKTWTVSDKAMDSLIKLCADICRRNGINKMTWKADKNLVTHPDQQNMTAHRWFAKTACPGDFLYSEFGYIAEEVNMLLDNVETNTEKPDVAIPTVRNGSKGDQALQLQVDLNYFGYGLAEDGLFGPKSAAALKQWQTKYGLVADGIYGTKSYNKMKELLK